MVKYNTEYPHKVYKKGHEEELAFIEETIKTKFLNWIKPKGKDFYIDQKGNYIHSLFQPTRKITDACFLLKKLHNIEIEKDDDRWFACIHTGETLFDEGVPIEKIFFVESETFELAVSLVIYEYTISGFH